jgi:uncharacterized membrane protein YhaH (DUF805 family)
MRHALDLFSWEGRVSRRQYILSGLLLLAIKYPVDLLIAKLHQHPWNPLMYVSPRVSPLFHYRDDAAYWIELLVWALPFMAAGVSLSARRLRDIGVSPFWAGLFFFPFVHFAFFAVLAVAPAKVAAAPAPTPDAGPFRDRQGPPLPEPRPPRFLDHAIPRQKGMAYLFGLLTSLVMGLLCYVITVQLSSVLGTMLFIGLPFGMGFWTAFCVSYGRTLGGWAGVGYGLTSIVAGIILLVAVAWEGMACVIMAFPILALIGALGAWVGWLVGRGPRVVQMAAPLMILLVPALVGVDVVRPPQPAPLAVVSEVVVHAPLETVWKNVVSFPPIDSTPPAIFAIVAMPLEARIDGRGPSAIRRCVFTNGTFVEPIEVWNEPRELTFGVAEQPHHLDEYGDIERGQFLLSANADGTTTLRGTTWYRLKVFPTAYWDAWAKKFLHAIHLRVLDHVKRISEDPSRVAAAAPAAQPDWMAASNETCNCTRHAHAKLPPPPATP